MECANINIQKECDWTDVHESRSKGGYPWTHLYKEPLIEEVDPEPFTMEGLRKARSSSTMGKSDLEIFEVTDFEIDSSTSTNEKPNTSQFVTEADDHSINKNTGSVTIEECNNSESTRHKTEAVMDSAESWDNISQYLDKEDRGPTHKDKQISTTDATDTPENIENERKRKLSGESSYSRLSQTKSALMKKFQDSKQKIKIPKLTFTTSKIKKPFSKKTKSSPTEIKKETKKRPSKDITTQKEIKPVYIHIPLKPPPGQVDEFTQLESGNQTIKDDVAETVDEQNKENVFKKMGKSKRIGGFKNLVKQIQESKLDEINEKENTGDIAGGVKENKISQKDTDKENNKSRTEEERNDANEKEDISKTEFSVKTKPPTFTIGPSEETHETEESSKSEDKTADSESSDQKHDEFEHLFHIAASKKLQEEDEAQKSQHVRSRSVEPERKRKLSLESSYSRKSLSKLRLMKKLKEASEKIKSKFSKSGSKTQINIKEEQEPGKVVEKKSKKLEPLKTKEPVYIHIPLKPPEGENDEFSNLSEKQQSIDSEISSTPDPDSPSKSGVQFIILTAPSDDEILDYNSSDVPETPSSENKMFFPAKITELKQLAKQAVDAVDPSGKKSVLDSVEEESNGEKLSDETNNEKTSENERNMDDEIVVHNIVKDAINETKNIAAAKDKEENEKLTVDEEDGLNETKVIKPTADLNPSTQNIEEKLPDIKSSMKRPDSPVIKKKVSFKRRSKVSRDDSNDEVQDTGSGSKITESSTKPQVVGLQEKVQQMVEPVKQEPHVTFAEEEKRWSDPIDHVYETVDETSDNYPKHPEIKPTIFITDTDYEPSILPLGDVTIEPYVQKKDTKSPDILRKTENVPPNVQPSEKTEVFRTSQQAESETPETNEPTTSNFQTKLRRQSENIKAKFQNIKRPKFNKPEFKKPEFKKPDFKKFKIDTSKINMPKIPDTAKIHLPTFSLGRKHEEKRSLKDRQLSTEANDGDSKKQFFDFGTFPRIFSKKQKTAKQTDEDETVNVDDIPAFATVPRKENKKKKDKWKGAVSIRVPLHSEDSMDKVENDDSQQRNEGNNQEIDQGSYLDNEDLDKPLSSSHIRYEEDIDIDDEYDHENDVIDRERDFADRWNKGMFNQNVNEMEYLENFKNSNYKVTDLDSPDDKPATDFETANNETNTRYSEFEQANNQNNNRYSEFDPTNNGNRTRYSSGSSLGHRRGVLEEIDSDEFIWRPKGISQEHIHMFVNPDMREAFQTPINTLLEMEKIQDTHEDYKGSRSSLPGEPNKRKPARKLKRIKTPHTSTDQIAQSEEWTDDVEVEEFPPSRPKRRSKRRKHRNEDEMIPYRETILVDDDEIPVLEDRLKTHRESLGVLGDDEQDEESVMSDHDNIEEKLRREIEESNKFHEFQYNNENNKFSHYEDRNRNVPPVPPRKQKSVKSLNLSENDSIFDDRAYNRAVSEDLSTGRDDNEPEIEAIRTESKIIIPIQQDLPPRKPSRTKSQTNSQSNLVPPNVDDSSSFGGFQEPCVEPVCIQDIRDPMGYAIVDRTKLYDPPLPPPRLPPRQKRSTKHGENPNFFTVPRSSNQNVPVRPLRNYSTLGQIKKASDEQSNYENKENIDVFQYVEIDDDLCKDLQSGEIIKKMKERPLPPPPRPPRKSRPLRDITSAENLPQTCEQSDKTALEETEVSTQTEPLPDDFICDELVEEPTDKIIIPSTVKDSSPSIRVDENKNAANSVDQIVEKRLITPTSYTYEETITHGSILVEPLNGARILPDSELTQAPKERVVPISNLSDDESSSIPEEFKKLSDMKEKQKHQQPYQINIEPIIPETLKTHKLQVTDLDVDVLNVSKLVADKIVCSEIESENIQTADISARNASINVNDIHLPPGVIEEIIKMLSSREFSRESESVPSDNQEEKKTPINDDPNMTKENIDIGKEENEDTPNPSSVDREETECRIVIQQSELLDNKSDDVAEPSFDSEEAPELVELGISEETNTVEDPPPIPPPRANSEHSASRLSKQVNQKATPPPENTILEPEIDDEPPPRPPQPQTEYIPSQPPPSFYALKAQKYVDDNIPVAPRRKRRTRSRARSRSSSDDSSTTRISRRFPRRYSDNSIAQLSGQLIRACGNEINHTLKRLITYVTNNVLGNADGTQDINVMIFIVLVLIAGLILLGYGNEKTVVHLHHWEYFNPPKDL